MSKTLSGRRRSTFQHPFGPAASPGVGILVGLTLMTVVSSLSACGGELVGFDDDTTAPTVSQTTPVNNAPAVAANSSLTATFSEPMDGATIDESSFVLRRDDLVIVSEVDFVGVTAILRPNRTLLPTAVYTATVSNTVTDLAGNAMVDDYVWTFTAGGIADPDAPLISFTSPANEAVDVPSSTVVLAVFTEPMDPTTFDSSTFNVFAGDTAVAGEIRTVGLTAIFDPTVDLDPLTLYTARVTNGVADVAGNAMVNDYVWTFTTAVSSDLTPPVVTSTVPADDAEGVAFGASIAAAFSENMDPDTLSTATVTLEQNGVRVEGSVVLTGVTASFRPAALLLPNTPYTVTIDETVADTSGNELGADYEWSFTTGAIADTTAPMVTETSPSNDQAGVGFNASATATFTEPMDALTLNTVSVSVSDGTDDIVGAVTYMGNTVTFDPFNPLLPETTYTVLIDSTVTDLSGNRMAANYEWSFTTGQAPDTERPQIVETSPVDGAVSIASNAPLVATFSETMNPATVTSAEFRVFNGTFEVPGTVVYAGLSATFTPTGGLNENSLYVARMASTVTDVAGNSMLRAYVWTFTTGITPDITAPFVASTQPVPDGGAVELPSSVVATFSEAMAPLTTATFVLRQAGNPVAGTVSNSGLTATFDPTDPLLPSTEYEAIVFRTATDAAGNPMLADFSWTFTTGVTPDVRRPEISQTWPRNGTTGVPIGGDIAAFVSEDIAQLTATASSFTLRRLGALVPGVVTSSESSMVFRPANTLDPLTTYVATVRTAVTDQSGNALQRSYAWNFRTGNSADTTAPTLIRTVPGFSAGGVNRSDSVQVEFSEVMDPISLNGATLELRAGAVLVPGTVVHLGSVAQFVPNSPLNASTVYNVTVTTGAEDLAGNALEENQTWSFTTGGAIDTTRPEVSSTNPMNGATEVARDSSINVSFGEDMDPLSLTVAAMTVSGPSGVEVFGTVRYLPASRLLSFTPSVTLLSSANYDVTVAFSARNLSGVTMLSNFSWSFTTSETGFSREPVSLGVLNGFAATAGNGLVNTNPSGFTVMNGNVALDPVATCSGDGVGCTFLNPIINGQLFVNDGGGVSSRAQSDASGAHSNALSRTAGTTSSLVPTGTYLGGVYSSAAGNSLGVSGTVTLNAAGNPDAVWVFQSDASITVDDDTRIVLANGALAQNVFWVAGSLIAVGSDAEMQGVLLADGNIVLGANSTLLGRAFTVGGLLSLASNSVTMPSL
jgi:hypothetical protein